MWLNVYYLLFNKLIYDILKISCDKSISSCGITLTAILTIAWNLGILSDISFVLQDFWSKICYILIAVVFKMGRSIFLNNFLNAVNSETKQSVFHLELFLLNTCSLVLCWVNKWLVGQNTDHLDKLWWWELLT